MAESVFANSKSSGNDLLYDALSEGRNYESPFGVNSAVSGHKSAQDISHEYMKQKQRRPFVIEYYKDPNDKKPKSITMYINPERLTIANSKIIGRQVTKGGIFYHHYGAGHSTMSLNGTTGLSGMAGIKQLEEIYYASGTLLRYSNYAPVQIYDSVKSFNTIDYRDPLGTVDAVVSGRFSTDMVEDTKKSLRTNNYGTITESLSNDCIEALDIYKVNQSLNKFTNTDLPNIHSQMTEWECTNDDIDYRSYYQKTLSSVKNAIPTYNDQIITNIAYELSLNKLYKELPSGEKRTAISNTKKDTVVSAIDFQKRKDQALANHIARLKDFYSREETIRNKLRSGLINIKDDMTDPWLPRQMIIYFENRAYVGHFESFQYSRDAKLNLINYEMKYTITKQYEFNNLNDATIACGLSDSGVPDTRPDGPVGHLTDKPIVSLSSSISGSSTYEPDPSELYTIKSKDTLQSIAKKFYGNTDYWMDIYAHNVDSIDDPNVIIAGQQIRMPNYSQVVRYWVVSSGDTLWSIAKRFYGDSSLYNRILVTNPDIKNPNVIYPKQVLKIVL